MDVDRMDIDPPVVAQADRRYREVERDPRACQPDGRGHPPERIAYPPEGRAYPSERSAYPTDGRDPRAYPQDRSAYPPDARAYPPEVRAYPGDVRSPYQPEPVQGYPVGARQPVTTYTSQDPRYASAYSTGDGAPPGYVRQGNYYVPVSGYEVQPGLTGRPLEPQYTNGGYAQPSAQGRDPRDPRYGSAPEYADPRDPRYAYPSPALTTVPPSREREPVISPPQARFAFTGICLNLGNSC